MAYAYQEALPLVGACLVPTGDVCVSETLAGIRREAPRKVRFPQEGGRNGDHLASAAGADPERSSWAAGRAALLVGFAGALRRSELAAIRFEQLEKTGRGIGLTLPRGEGEQTDAVTVPLPYCETELCPIRALDRATGPRLDRRTGVPEDLVASLSETRETERAPSAAPDRQRRDHLADRGADHPGARWRLVSGGTPSAVTVSNAARSPPE